MVSKNIIFVLFGSSGRLGGLVKKVLLNLGHELFIYSKNGTYLDISSENIDYSSLVNRAIRKDSKLVFCDCSVDYSSIEHFNAHEEFKITLMKSMVDGNLLHAYIGFSSGVVQFNPNLINDNFKNQYRTKKLQTKEFLLKNSIACFYPDIFTLIGQNSYKFGSTGWVDVLNQALHCDEDELIKINHPYELRSWVSEKTIENSLIRFISLGKGQYFGAIVDGEFSLSMIVDIVNISLKRNRIIKTVQGKGWLLCSYMNQFLPLEVGKERFDDQIRSLFL